MTLDHIEDRLTVAPEHNEKSATLHSVLDLIIKNCTAEIEEHTATIHSIFSSIESIKAKQRAQRLRMKDSREVMAIYLEVDELEVTMMSLGENTIKETLRAQLEDLESAYTRERNAVENFVIMRIRCIEVLEQQLFEASSQISY